jgi:hypothetical protein
VSSESIVSRRTRFPVGPVRRVRSIGPWLSRRPWASVVLLLVAAAALSVAIDYWPAVMPWTVYTFLVVAAGLFLEPRLLLVVFVGIAVAMASVGWVLRDLKTSTIGASIVTVATMVLMMWLSRARSEAGVVGVGGESMLVDMRDRLRAQSDLPPLPESWGAEVALESAYGDGFSGDFVVASRSTDGRLLEIALVDVSGKGREAGARSLLLSGALGGLLGEMSEGGFLQAANNHLLRLRWPEGFATAVHVAVDLETGEFTIGYAGHPAAAQFAAGSGRWRMLSGGRGPLLGIIDRAVFPREVGTLRHGDALVLYSDGVIEARNKALVDGIDRMLGRAESFIRTGFEGLAQRLCDQAAAGLGDDRAVVTIWRS